MEKEIKSVTSDGTVMKQKISKILLEILVYGKETDKDKIHALLQKIQKQLDTKKAKNRARILWRVEKEETTEDERHKWFMENTNSKYYIYVDKGENFDVSENYVDDLLDKIKNLEKSYEQLKKSNINFYKG